MKLIIAASHLGPPLKVNELQTILTTFDYANKIKNN